MSLKDKGASAEADRAVVNGAASVSALRASVPSAAAKYPVESGIPIPERRSGKSVVWGAPKYPWDEMNVGDSFLVPGDGGAQQQIRVNTASSSRTRRYPGEFFVTRAEEGIGVRVWRTTRESTEWKPPSCSMAEVEARARETWGRVSPYRIGLIVGQSGLRLDVPRHKGRKWNKLFRQGVADAQGIEAGTGETREAGLDGEAAKARSAQPMRPDAVPNTNTPEGQQP